MSEVICRNEQRREQVRRQKQLIGLDYLEVGPLEPTESAWADQHLLRVYFLGKAPLDLNASNLRIEGGRRITDLQVIKVEVKPSETVELDDYMVVTVDRVGDFSTYTLRVVEKVTKGEKSEWQPHSAFDQRYNSLDFSFKVDCPNELDCKQNSPCPPEPLQEPNLNYLAKDYGSFRQLILDRLALTMPEWQERHVPDIGMALVEILAYTGDHLSYYQDAVATEAYLHTARQRISVRRHARLVDYTMHEGCNARAWVAVKTGSNLSLSPKGFFFIAGADKALQTSGNVLNEEDLRQVQASQYKVFEPMGDADIQLYQSHHRISFYTWGDKECCLPRGTMTATLYGKLVQPEDKQSGGKPSCLGKNDPKQGKPQEQMQEAVQEMAPQAQQAQQVMKPTEPTTLAPKLHLKAGDILIFEEVKGPKTGHQQDADPKHRHAVRLTKVEAVVDRLDNTPAVDISWAEEDALPFPLCISSLGPAPDCRILENVSIARGNIILVDHGRTRKEKDLGAVPLKEEIEHCESEGRLADKIRIPGIYRPSLDSAPLTFSQPLAANTPASTMLVQDVRQALPWVELAGIKEIKKESSPEQQETQSDGLVATEDKGEHPAAQYKQEVQQEMRQEPPPDPPANSQKKDEVSEWAARADLLASGPDDCHFVAEMDNDGRAHLRFGNDEFGEQPEAGMHFVAQYRTGNGPAGNVGAETITRLVFRGGQLSGAGLSIRNPLPAQGGTAAEPLEEVRLYAPHTFRRKLQRAITAEDYADIVEREFRTKVQHAAARLRWNGSWHEVLVAIDPLGQEVADQALLDAITARLHRYRRIGHDLVVRSAEQAPLEIGLRVCVLPNYLRGHVKAALLGLFSNRILSDGRRGFFHPDNLTFGDGIYVSKLTAAAQGVTGVESVQVTRLRRYKVSSQQKVQGASAPVSGQVEPDQAIIEGILPLDAFEVARLDNDPNFPENGIFELDMRGGR